MVSERDPETISFELDGSEGENGRTFAAPPHSAPQHPPSTSLYPPTSFEVLPASHQRHPVASKNFVRNAMFRQ